MNVCLNLSQPMDLPSCCTVGVCFAKMASKEDEVGASGDSHGHTQADNAAMMAKLASIADRVTKKTRAQMPPIATPGRVLLKEGVVLKKGTSGAPHTPPFLGVVRT